MTNPVHARIRVGGALYSDARWSVSCAFAVGDGGDPFADDGIASPQTRLESWRDAVQALNGGNVLIDDIRRFLSTAGTVDMIRCARIGTDGRETHVALAELGAPKPGLGAAVHPAQVAAVASLTTGRPGGSYRGRMYWPALGLVLGAGRIPTDDAANLAAGTASWLNSVGDALISIGTLTGQPMVVSTKFDRCTPVTGVRVGNRLDSQSRRAEGETELYSSAVVPN